MPVMLSNTRRFRPQSILSNIKRGRHTSSIEPFTEEKKPKVPITRYIELGYHLDSRTGRKVGIGKLPLSKKDGINESIGFSGESGAGKSVVMRKCIEYFSLIERRCVIIIDPKGQYWSLGRPMDGQDKPEMLQELLNTTEDFRQPLSPMGIPDVDVYAPIYDIIDNWDIIQRDFHATKMLSLRTDALTASSFFDLGNVDSTGRLYHPYMEMILRTPKAEKKIETILQRLDELIDQEKSIARSITSLKNILIPIWRQGILRDDGTDVGEMLHPPRKNRPGKVSVISLKTSPSNDRRRDAVVASVIQQILWYAMNNPNIKPVVVVDETKEFAPSKKTEHEATQEVLSKLQLQGRAWGITRLWGWQKDSDVADWLLGSNTPINIIMRKTHELIDDYGNTTKLQGRGYGTIKIHDLGDDNIPEGHRLVKFLPCRTKHID